MDQLHSPTQIFELYDCDVSDSCSTCEDTCYSQSCEFWGQYGYTCSVLENTYGCACDGCSC